MKFSERYGFKPVKDLVQIDSMDEPLRNVLWSLLQMHVWGYIHESRGPWGGCYLSNGENQKISDLCRRLWFSYFKKPLDTLDDKWTTVYDGLRRYFFEAKWYEIYDFLEFICNNYERYQFRDNFITACNYALEREVSAYRFVDGVVTRITEQQELEEIDDALTRAKGPVRTHLRRSLELLSNRENPDYRNSIKESISSVESLVLLLLKQEKGTLGQLLKQMEEQYELHPALKASFSSLYGYTSDEGGIRHALLESESIRFEDAKFFLVVCSAFINFIMVKVGISA